MAKAFAGERFLNCDLPSTAALLEDPEGFFSGLDAGTLVLDEIHQLTDTSRILKIAADGFSQTAHPGHRIVDLGRDPDIPR